MDMFTGDMENWLHYVEVDDVRHSQMLGEILESRDFSAHGDASNIEYAFEMTKWVAEHFEYLTYARSNELEGEALPTHMKSLIALEWSPGGDLHIVYPSGSTISLELKTVEEGPLDRSTLEKFVGDMFKRGKPLLEAVEDMNELIKFDDTLMEEHLARKEEAVVSESVVIEWSHPMSTDSGLELSIGPSGVTVLPYGKREYMPQLQNCATYLQHNLTELAITVSELVVLAAQNCQTRVPAYFTDRKDIDDFAKRVANL